MMYRCLALMLLALPAWAQIATARLPLPLDGTPEALGFETPGPTASVLTGFLWPSGGPLTAWAPVFSSFGADGSLTEVLVGRWTGPVPGKWLKVVKPGWVVGGFRVLMKTAPGTPQVRQIQVFWKPWKDGEPEERVVESQVYGSPAGPQDQVRIIELRVPPGAVPTGLYGQTLRGVVTQASLLVRLPEPKASQPPSAPAAAPRGPQAPRAPTVSTPF